MFNSLKTILPETDDSKTNFPEADTPRDRRPGRKPIPYICDFSRYEKSSSMKRPTLKVIDFDSVVQNTKSSKSITFHVGLF